MYYPSIKYPELVLNLLERQEMTKKNQEQLKSSSGSSRSNVVIKRMVNYPPLVAGLICIIGWIVFWNYFRFQLNIQFYLGIFFLLILFVLLSFSEEKEVIQETTVTSTVSQKKDISIDWGQVSFPEMIISGTSTANRGKSEAFFAGYLKVYFDDYFQEGQEFIVPGKDYRYSSDFQLVLPQGLWIQVEIDEPYVLSTSEPHHCYDTGKDQARDRFFLDGGWIVIRFSEEQVVRYPEGCCRYIADRIKELVGDCPTLSLLEGYPYPLPSKCWTVAEATRMAKSQYRQRYLAAAKLI